MPVGAPLPKVAATKGYGACTSCRASVDEALIAAHEFAGATGAAPVHPFDHPDVIAGQGTVGLEILEQLPEVTTIVTCAGGGGLSPPRGRGQGAGRTYGIVGVQATRRPRRGRCRWPQGGPVTLPSMRTIADGIAVGRPGDLTFTHVCVGRRRPHGGGGHVPGAAASAWSARSSWSSPPGWRGRGPDGQPDRFATPVVAVLSGGNIDPLVLLHVIQHGMAAAARYLTLGVRLGDAPGALAGLLTLVAEHGGNVLDVAHTRTSVALGLGEVDVHLSMETRGPQHCAELVAAIQAAGHTVVDETVGVRSGTAPRTRARPSCCRRRAACTRGCRRRGRR